MEELNLAKLTLKQRKWIKYYLETGNATQAAMRAYNCKNEVSAASIGYQNFNKLQILIPLRAIMEKKGLDLGSLLEVVVEGLKANKVLGYLNNKTNGVDKVSDEFVETPDHATRHKFLTTALELLKLLKASDVHIDNSKHLTFQDIKLDPNRPREDIARELSEMLLNQKRI